MNEWEWELCERKGAKYEDWADKLIITMSERGCLYQNEVYPVNRDIEVRDLTVNKDLVCGMLLEDGSVADTTLYEGKLYGFCAAECKTAFLDSPQVYLAQ